MTSDYSIVDAVEKAVHEHEIAHGELKFKDYNQKTRDFYVSMAIRCAAELPVEKVKEIIKSCEAHCGLKFQL